MEARYPVLVGEIAKRGVKKKAIADAIKVKDRTLRNKVYGVTPFTWPEVNTIRDTFFPDMALQDLFERAESKGA